MAPPDPISASASWLSRHLITGKLGSYGAARRDLRSSGQHISYEGMNNRAENSHQPLRIRERIMQEFRSIGGCQRFVYVFQAILYLSVSPASNDNGLSQHANRVRALARWNSVTELAI